MANPWDGVPCRRWGLEEWRRDDGRWQRRVHWFAGQQQRREWVAKNPLTRVAIGKRHPSVKRFRNGLEP